MRKKAPNIYRSSNFSKNKAQRSLVRVVLSKEKPKFKWSSPCFHFQRKFDAIVEANLQTRRLEFHSSISFDWKLALEKLFIVHGQELTEIRVHVITRGFKMLSWILSGWLKMMAVCVTMAFLAAYSHSKWQRWCVPQSRHTIPVSNVWDWCFICLANCCLTGVFTRKTKLIRSTIHSRSTRYWPLIFSFYNHLPWTYTV